MHGFVKSTLRFLWNRVCPVLGFIVFGICIVGNATRDPAAKPEPFTEWLKQVGWYQPLMNALMTILAIAIVFLAWQIIRGVRLQCELERLNARADWLEREDARRRL